MLLLAGGCKNTELRGARVIASEAAVPSPGARFVSGPDERAAGAAVAAGSLRDPVIIDKYAVLLPSGGDAVVALRAAATIAEARGFALGDALTGKPVRLVRLETGTVAESGFHIGLLRHFGRGLSAADTAALANANKAVLISVSSPATDVADLLHGSAAMAHASAAAVHGWIQDRVTFETFTVAAFDAQRPDGFPLDIRDLVVYHVVAGADSTVFFQTLGMARFGLPELYLQGIPQGFVAKFTQLYNAAAQTLVERGGLARDGELEVELRSLTTGSWPAVGVEIAQAGGPGNVKFEVTWSRADDPDAPGPPRYLELTLPNGPLAEQVNAAIIGFYGYKRDEIYRAQDTDVELQEARERALAELATLAPHFARGIPELEQLLVKAPFRTDEGGIEWMWVEINAWEGDRLLGILINTPEQVAALRAGARVDVRQTELFDYLHRRADGTIAGGKTNEILQRRKH